MRKSFTFGFLALLVIMIVGSCKNSPAILKSIQGNWYCEYNGALIKETWEAVAPGHLTGVGSEIIEGSEKVIEYLELKNVGGSLTYIATVIEQNDAKPVMFTQSSETSTSITFENPAHDFPQFISYEIIDGLNMKVTIGKLPTDQGEKIEFLFSRNQPQAKN